MKKNKTYYYKAFDDDFVVSKKQEYKLPQNYKWIHSNLFYSIFSGILYRVAKFFGAIYCKFILHVKIENKNILKEYKNQGYFLYGNHTQPVGDVFIPGLTSKKRIYTIASPSNMGVFGIGPFLPMLGILPIPEDMGRTKQLLEAVKTRINEKNAVVIYPEAHVWPYYTKIRHYKSVAFKFPVDTNSLCFCMTTAYYKRKNGKKPGIKVYIDGPFQIETTLNKKENQEKLCKDIYECMVRRSENSNFEYIKYVDERKIM